MRKKIVVSILCDIYIDYVISKKNTKDRPEDCRLFLENISEEIDLYKNVDKMSHNVVMKFLRMISPKDTVFTENKNGELGYWELENYILEHKQ